MGLQCHTLHPRRTRLWTFIYWFHNTKVGIQYM